MKLFFKKILISKQDTDGRKITLYCVTGKILSSSPANYIRYKQISEYLIIFKIFDTMRYLYLASIPIPGYRGLSSRTVWPLASWKVINSAGLILPKGD